MTTTPRLLERALRRLLWSILALSLAACGPGTGGTGTGPEQVLEFTSVPAGTASSPGVATPAAAPSSAPSRGSDSSCESACPGVRLRLEPTRVELTAPCLRFVSSGDSQPDRSGLVLLDGSVERGADGSARTSAARLRLQFPDRPERSQEVIATLLDERSQSLLGPLVVRRFTGEQVPGSGACGVG